jgi:hypothetical protein
MYVPRCTLTFVFFEEFARNVHIIHNFILKSESSAMKL